MDMTAWLVVLVVHYDVQTAGGKTAWPHSGDPGFDVDLRSYRQ